MGILHLPDQAPHSVRLIKLVNISIAAKAQSVSISVPSAAQLGKNIVFQANADPDGTPVVHYHWNFGDGTRNEGRIVHHAYTGNGTYSVTLVAVGVDEKETVRKANIVIQGTLSTTYDVKDYRRYQDSPNH